MGEEPQDATPASPVPRSLRWGSFLLSTLLMFLFVWLLGFALDDIGDIDGPDYRTVMAEYVDASLRERADSLKERITGIETQVARQEELQQDLKRSMDNARETMQQMMDLQRLSLERQVTPSEIEREALATAQQRFLEAQDRFELANAEIAASNETRFELRQELQGVQGAIGEQEQPARDEQQRRERAHQFRIATLKLSVIVPLFLVAAWAFSRYRASAYRSILLALLLASFWKVGRVMFDHFPREFFKYIAIVAAIAIVLAFLIWMLRKAARPSRALLLDRYREAYRMHMCPVCAYPIARGPLRFALWTRRGPKAATVDSEAGGDVDRAARRPYACPSCGTTLFSGCKACGEQRHALLPFCEHCGDEELAASLARADSSGSAAGEV
ncbi:MAG: hypothetical protein ACYTG2_03255 [Planctomycetota bacterium]|jgi:hypothetical protein